MLPPSSIITLLSDFGDRDFFVASMKGVILTIHPGVRIVDLTHHIVPYHIEEAAYVLKACYPYYPDGTVHVCVVDPGVGTSRRPLLVSTSRQYFIAPDNGLLTFVLRDEPQAEIRQIENHQYRLSGEGRTFDGRDVFAPAAAFLAKGEQPASFGRIIDDPLRFPVEEPRWQDRRLEGSILYVDRFGNLISNITAKHLAEAQTITQHSQPTIQLAGYTIEGLIGSYSEGRSDRPSALINSGGYVEVFLKNENAAHVLQVQRGVRVDLV